MAGKRNVTLFAFLIGVVLLSCPLAFTGLSLQASKSSPPRALRGAVAKGKWEVPDGVGEETSPFKLGGAFVSIMAALLLAVMPVAEAQAAKGGGRMGGTAPSMKPRPPPAAAPRSSTTNTTVINRTTVVAPPLVVAPPPVVVASPIVVAPAPTIGDVIVGAAVQGAVNSAIMSSVPHGPSTTDRIMENQIRQDERQLDRQANQIDDLKRELAQLKK